MLACILKMNPEKPPRAGSTTWPRAWRGPGGRGQLHEGVEEELDPEVGQRASEEHRRLLPAPDARLVEAGTSPLEEVDVGL